jgi:hypothetical protein
MAWVIEKSTLSGGPLVVLLMIANHAKTDGTGAWPSVATLAKESRMSERNVRYCIREAEFRGELLTHMKGGPYGSNLYSLPLMGGAKIAPLGAVCDTGRGKMEQEMGQPSAPNPSLTIPKDKDVSPKVEVLNQRLEDYYQRRWKMDENGKRYLVSPSTGERVYDKRA